MATGQPDITLPPPQFPTRPPTGGPDVAPPAIPQFDPNAATPEELPQPAPPPVSTGGNLPQPTPTMPTQASTPTSDLGLGPQPGLPAPFTDNPAQRGGAVKNALTRMLYGFGQAGLQHVGLPTDYDIQKLQFDQAIKANDLRLAQMKEAREQQESEFQRTLVPVTTAAGTFHLPYAAAARLLGIQEQGQNLINASQIKVRFQKTPYGLIDTHIDTGGQPELIEGSAGPTITIGPEHIQRYGLDPQLLDRTLTTADYTKYLNSAARWAPQYGTTTTVLQTDDGPKTVSLPRVTQRGGGGGVAPSPTTAPGAGPSVAPAAAPTAPTAGAASATPSTGGGAVPPAKGNAVPPAARKRMPPGTIAKAIIDPATGKQVVSDAAFREYDNKYLAPANSVEESYQKMAGAYNDYKKAQAEGKTLPTGAESMLALSQHIQTTFGTTKGARVTEAMIQKHLGAIGVTDQMRVMFQKLNDGDVLSPDQWEAFNNLISNSRNIKWRLATQYGQARHINVTPFLPSDLQQSLGGAGGAGGGNQPAAHPFFGKFGGQPRKPNP